MYNAKTGVCLQQVEYEYLLHYTATSTITSFISFWANSYVLLQIGHAYNGDLNVGGYEAMRRDSFLRNDDQYMGCLKYPIGIAVAQEPTSTGDGEQDVSSNARDGGGPLLYVCDGDNTRIVVFDAITGDAIRTIRNGDDAGVVNFVKTMNVNSNGINVYIDCYATICSFSSVKISDEIRRHSYNCIYK